MSVVREKSVTTAGSSGIALDQAGTSGSHQKVLPDKCALLPGIAIKKTVQHIVRQLQIQYEPYACTHAPAQHTHAHTHAHAHARTRKHTRTAQAHIPYRASPQIALIQVSYSQG